MTQAYEQRPRKRWGRRLLITLIVLLLLIGVLLVAADRIGKSVAERMIGDQVAEQVANQQAKSEKPDVTVQGFPFLTQVLDGNYQEIKIGLRNFTGPAGENKTIKVPLLDVRAKDVDAPLDTLRSRQGSIVAKTVTGTGTVDYAQVAQLIGQNGLKVSEKDGKLWGSAPVEIPGLGRTFTVSGTANLTVKDGVVQVRFADVTAAELPNIPLVRSFIDSYVNQLAIDLRVPELPLKLQVQKVEPQADGLKFTAGASNVQFNAGGL